jgi:hypothetical protein
MFASIEHKPNEVLRLFAKGTTEHCAIWSPVRMQDVASLSNVVTVIIVYLFGLGVPFRLAHARPVLSLNLFLEKFLASSLDLSCSSLLWAFFAYATPMRPYPLAFRHPEKMKMI